MKPNEAYVIGLTGGIACGKTHVAEALRAQGVRVLDADAISHALTAPGGEALPAIRARFGETVFAGETLDRRALGERVFADAQARRALEEILHPRIIARMREQTEQAGGLVAWDVPLLYETGMERFCGEVWCVYVAQSEQARRVMRRDGLSRAQARNRIRSQMPLAEKKRRAQHLIHTAGSLRQTHRRVRGLLRDLKRRLNVE